MTSEPQIFSMVVPLEAAGQRLDRYLSTWLEPHGLTRSRVQALIDAGDVRLNDVGARSAIRLKGGERIDVRVPPARSREIVPTEMSLEVLYEDTWLMVINKPPGLVVHPARGAEEGTLVHGLLFHVGDLSACLLYTSPSPRD